MINDSKLRKCKYCKKDFNKRMRLCPFCGGEHKKEITQKIPLCPRCKCELKNKNYRNVTIESCPECSGLWLDTSDFSRLTSEREVYSDDKIPYEYQKKPLPEIEGYFPCVRCGSFMIRKMFKKISGVIIDICIDHGVWLDDKELEQIRCFIANGGLEKHQEYLSNQIVKNHSDIQKLSRSVDNIKFMQKMMHLYSPKYWLLKLLY